MSRLPAVAVGLGAVFLLGGGDPELTNDLGLQACAGTNYVASVNASPGHRLFGTDVYLRTFNGAYRAVTHEGRSYDPTISDDAVTLAYVRGERQTLGDVPAPGDDVYVRTLGRTASAERLLVQGWRVQAPDLSPDGRYLALPSQARPVPEDEPAPSKPRAPTQPPLVLNNPRYEPLPPTPLRYREPATRIYVVSVPSGEVVATVASPPGVAREEQASPVFSPNGRELAYVSTSYDARGAGISSTLRIVPIGSGRPGRPVETLVRPSPRGNLRWSLDGGAISIGEVDHARSSAVSVVELADGRIRRYSADGHLEAQLIDSSPRFVGFIGDGHVTSTVRFDGGFEHGDPAWLDDARHLDIARCAYRPF